MAATVLADHVVNLCRTDGHDDGRDDGRDDQADAETAGPTVVGRQPG